MTEAATQPARYCNWNQHDWRMHSREPREEYKTINQEDALGWGNVTITRVGWDEVWYCIVCRHIENRFVPE